jgi:hypothetical protein
MTANDTKAYWHIPFVRSHLNNASSTRHLRHIRNYGFLAHNQRGTKLPLIRRLLGLPDAAAEEDDEELGGGQPPAEAVLHACPCCADGVLVLELALPRPSIAEIMRMTLDQLRQLPLPFG